MADTRPTRINFFRAVYLCGLLLLAPKRFLAEEDADNKLRSERTDKQQKEPSAFVVRRAFWTSLALVVLSGLFGGIVGFVLKNAGFCAKPVTVVGLQVFAALMLLWGPCLSVDGKRNMVRGDAY